VSGELHAPTALPPGTHSIGGWVDPRAGLDDEKKSKLLTLSGLEIFPLSRQTDSDIRACNALSIETKLCRITRWLLNVGVAGEMRIGRGNRSTGRKYALVSLCPHKFHMNWPQPGRHGRKPGDWQPEMRGGLINLWLYKENNKLRDWIDIFTLHITPWAPHTYDFVVLISLKCGSIFILILGFKVMCLLVSSEPLVLLLGFKPYQV
jgi:hypothetical protein